MTLMERLAKGAHRWMIGDREVYRVHFRGETSKDNDEYISRLCARMGTSPDSPEWRTEMEVDPDAFHGQAVYPEWDDKIHSGAVAPDLTPEWKQVAGIDYGVVNATAIHLGRWNGHWLRIWHTHYASGHNEQWHKGMVAAKIAAVTGKKAPDDQTLRSFFWMSLGDPQGAGYHLNYALPPHPWPHTFKVGGRMLNEPRVSESSLKTLLALNGVCCGRILYVETCPTCKKQVERQPGIVVDSSCSQIRLQMRLARRKLSPEGLETPEVSEKIEDHASDALRYMAHGLVLLMQAPPKRVDIRKEVDDDGRRTYRPTKPKAKTALGRIYGGGQ